jgi:alkanesulfonate monooxygenase SsuD/methylene tetrahydromethanopterin reductase-like flavin-dependent oxidoreductase (luciferase family)
MTKLVGKISDGVFINMGTPSTIKQIVSRVREGAVEAGRDPNSIEIIAKVRCSLNPDRALARSKLKQGLTFYNIADHYKDMLIASGFEPEVMRIQEAFKAGGFKAAMVHMTDEYMDKLPVIPGTSIQEIKERLEPFREAGVTRLVVPYVPVKEPVIDDARNFVEAWGNG